MENKIIANIVNEYNRQDNRSTAYPIYVVVQELVCIGVMSEGYSICVDGENRTKYKHPDLDDGYDSEEELIKALGEYYEDTDKLNLEIGNIEALNMGYVWIDVEFFLTIKGAEEYMKANAHNHGELRTYVDWFEDRNFEMRSLLKELGCRVK